MKLLLIDKYCFMKKMTCNDLGGACDLVLEANTFEELVEKSKMHGFQMFQQGDPAHLEAIGRMQKMMESPEEVAKWMADVKAKFEAL